jgi:hypothetical protein
MRPYLITAKLMRPSNMKRFPTPGRRHTSQLRAAEFLLGKAVQPSKNFTAFMKPEGSLPRPQQSASDCYPEAYENSPHTPYDIALRSTLILSETSSLWSSRWSVSFTFLDQNFIRISHILRVCYMSRPSHPSFGHPNNIR